MGSRFVKARLPIRVACLCGEYPRATDTFIQREVAALQRRGMHVETISVRRPAVEERGTDEQRAERERTHYLLPCSPWRLIADHLSLAARSPVRYLRACRTAMTIRSPGLLALLYQVFYFAEAGLVAARMRRCGLTHLHNHAPTASGYVTMLAAELGGFTYSLALHGFGAFSEPGRCSLTEKLERARFVICVSQHARSQAMLWSNRSCWSRYHVVHCGVDLARYDVRRHSGVGGRLLFVGRFDAVKGLPVLFDALTLLVADHPDVRLDLAGDGPQRADLETLVRDEGLAEHVRFLGYRSSAQLREHYAQADVVVMSSFAEGVPVVLMEAMASGLPVVAPRITGIPELVEDGVSGLLVPPGNAESLAAATDRLLCNPDLRNRVGQAGRAVVEREFNLDAEVESLAAIFEAELGVGDVSDAAVARLCRTSPTKRTVGRQVDPDTTAAASQPLSAGAS